VLPFPTIEPARADEDARAALGSLIRTIIAQDDENELLLRAQMGTMKHRMAHIARGAVAGRSYAATLSRPRSGTGLDRKG
jgi:hypothetical protein